MLNNIFQALDSLGLTAQKRALHILFSNPDLNAQVFLQRIDGKHQLIDLPINERSYSFKAIHW